MFIARVTVRPVRATGLRRRSSLAPPPNSVREALDGEPPCAVASARVVHVFHTSSDSELMLETAEIKLDEDTLGDVVQRVDSSIRRREQAGGDA